MKIILAEHFGMCFGVRDAIAQAEQLAGKGPLTILGELVHNPVVRERLTALGVMEALAVPSDQGRASVPTERVMITAHGTSDSRRAQLRKAGFDLADGTCPLVRHAHEQLRSLVHAGYFPVVIGKRGHVEVEGLIGDFPQAQVLESAAQIATLPADQRRFGIISQTTQPLDRVSALVEAVRAARPGSEVRFCDTICKPTKNRQNALKRLLSEAEVIVIVGGHNSNNTRQLVKTSRAAGRVAHHVERPEDLRAEWFDGVAVAGLTAGTSTLKETVKAVHRRMEELTSHLQ
jgi:4-hydroxy-3-methylbut-2-enyl diphosphate reductase